MKERVVAAALACGLVLEPLFATAGAQEPYYKGKTVRFLVNFSAGGPAMYSAG